MSFPYALIRPWGRLRPIRDPRRPPISQPPASLKLISSNIGRHTLIDACIYYHVAGRSDGRTVGRTDGWTDKQTHGWPDGRSDGRTNRGQMDGRPRWIDGQATVGRKGQMDTRTVRRSSGRSSGRMDRHTVDRMVGLPDEQSDRRSDGRSDGRTGSRTVGCICIHTCRSMCSTTTQSGRTSQLDCKRSWAASANRKDKTATINITLHRP
jgi:hypothetical protein